jgi:cobalt-zinc-cadmium efflux system membrane fusion protein
VRVMQRMMVLALLAALAACGGSSDVATDDDHDAAGAEAAHGEGEEHEAVPRQTTIAAKTAQTAGIRVAAAGPGDIADEHQVQGLLTPVEGRVAQVMARFPGPIRALRANVGDRVRAGQPLASIESNLSLTTYTVSSPLSGVVLARNASVGSVAGEGMALYEIADLSDLWVDLHIFGADAQHIRAGVPVSVTRMSDGVTAETTLERVLPGTATASQSTVARATIKNLDGLWRPGSAVKARVTVDRQAADLVVPLTALQSAEAQDVVYVREGETTYHTRPVKIGRRDAQRVEILSGLKRGEQVVIEQSFLVKADIEKSTVEEDH